jgi:hypothetical protein
MTLPRTEKMFLSSLTWENGLWEKRQEEGKEKKNVCLKLA